MKRQRIYVDTSVIGGCFDDEFSEASNKLMEEFEQGIHLPVLSPIVWIEAKDVDAPVYVGKKYDWLVSIGAQIVPITEPVEMLSRAYLKAGIVTEKYAEDALHIAAAVVHAVDLVVSWNFRHIVHFDKIEAYNAVGAQYGYEPIAIHSPVEVISYD